jgi:hypothetical protein
MPADLLTIEQYTTRHYKVTLAEPGKVPVSIEVPDLGETSLPLLDFFLAIKTALNDAYNFKQK